MLTIIKNTVTSRVILLPSSLSTGMKNPIYEVRVRRVVGRYTLVKYGVGLLFILKLNPVRENSSFERVIIFVSLRLPNVTSNISMTLLFFEQETEVLKICKNQMIDFFLNFIYPSIFWVVPRMSCSSWHFSFWIHMNGNQMGTGNSPFGNWSWHMYLSRVQICLPSCWILNHDLS